MSKIEVRPVPRKPWHGKVGQESFKRPITLFALVDGKTMKYSTGLDNTKPFELPDNSKLPANKEKLTEVEYFSKLIGKDLNDTFIPGNPHPFWDEPISAIKLEDHPVMFDTDNPLDYIKVKVLKASKYVANSMKEFQEGLFPQASHIIFDEKEEVEMKATKVEIRNKAIIESSKLPRSRKEQIVTIMSGKNVKDKSNDFVEVELDKLINNKASDVLFWINADKKNVKIRATVIEAIQKNIIRNNTGRYTYMELELGFDINEVTDFLSQDKNQELLIRIEEEIK